MTDWFALMAGSDFEIGSWVHCDFVIKLEFVIFEAFFHVSDIYELVQAVIFLTNGPATANPEKAFDYRLSFPLIQA